MVGRTLNHYRIEAHLGRGGMGEVYLAEDTKLGRKVALKVLPAAMADDSERRKRFEREAKAVAALNHPNIVTLFSVEEAEGVHFTTMELVQGKTIGELLPGKGFRLERLLDYTIAISDAVSAAHRQGITHRDLKPDNIMVGEDGRLKVLDFGLAKLKEELPGDENAGTRLPTASVTQEGKILGTVAYMSPEQGEGKVVDVRSDVFSLGIIIYEMATGKRPFQGDTPMSTISSIIKETPASITNLNQALPRHLARIVKKCLEKDPDRRYQGALDLRNDLMGLKEEVESGELTLESVTALPKTGSRLKWVALALGGVGLIALALTLPRLLERRPPAAVRSNVPLQNMEITRLTSTGNAGEAAISRDGQYASFVIQSQGMHSVWVTNIASGSKVEIVPPSEGSIIDPAFSPTGDAVYYIQFATAGYPSLYKVPVLGGTPRKILDRVNERISFSPDGTRFVFVRRNNETRENELIVSDADGTDEKVIAKRSFPDFYGDPVWSPDGALIATTTGSLSEGLRGKVVVIPADGGEEEAVGSFAWGSTNEASWLPGSDGFIVNGRDRSLAAKNQLWELSYPEGNLRRVTNDLNDYEGANLDADGTSLVMAQYEVSTELWILTPGRELEMNRLGVDRRSDHDWGLDWKVPDAITFGSNQGGNLNIWTISPAGGEATRLTEGREYANIDPAMTPDGRHIIFTSDRSGTVNIWRMNVDGSQPIQLTHGSYDIGHQVSPDGKWVYFRGGENLSLRKVPLDGGDSVPVLEMRISTFQISPDGQRLAARVWHEEMKRWKIEILSVETKDLLQDMDAPIRSFRWTPDGEALSYADNRTGAGAIWRQPLAGGDPERIAQFDEGEIWAHAWSPDGKQLAVIRGEAASDIVLLKNFR